MTTKPISHTDTGYSLQLSEQENDIMESLYRMCAEEKRGRQDWEDEA